MKNTEAGCINALCLSKELRVNQNFYACHNNSNGRNVCYDFSKTQALNNLKNSSKKRKVFTSRTSSECLMYVQFTFCVYWIGNSMIFGNSFGYLLWGNSVFICLMCLFSSSFPNKNKTKNKRIIIFSSRNIFSSPPGIFYPNRALRWVCLK